MVLFVVSFVTVVVAVVATAAVVVVVVVIVVRAVSPIGRMILDIDGRSVEGEVGAAQPGFHDGQQ